MFISVRSFRNSIQIWSDICPDCIAEITKRHYLCAAISFIHECQQIFGSKWILMQRWWNAKRESMWSIQVRGSKETASTGLQCIQISVNYSSHAFGKPGRCQLAMRTINAWTHLTVLSLSLYPLRLLPLQFHNQKKKKSEKCSGTKENGNSISCGMGQLLRLNDTQCNDWKSIDPKKKKHQNGGYWRIFNFY